VEIMNAITVWRPRRALLPLRASLDRLFDEPWLSPVEMWTEPPRVDMYREDGHLVVKAEVPGISAEELEVTVKDNILTISGETQAEEEVEEENYIRRERNYGSFCRSVALPSEAEGDKAEASFEDGVLNLTIPMAEEPQEESVKIPVKGS
jgi:HSP20 family protein